MSTPLISVGMPVYNAAPYLAAAIEGVINQSYENIELVITDNCSTDGSADIARDYASRFPEQVRFFSNQWNIGYSGNAYKATSLCKGDFILMHGADDVLMPGAFQAYSDLISNNNSPEHLVLMSDFEQGNAKGESQIRCTLDVQHFSLSKQTLDFLSPERVVRLNGHDVLKTCLPELRSFGGVGSVLVARKLYEQVEGYLNHHWFNPDKFFIYKILSLNPQIIWLCEPLYFYRVHERNQLSLQRGTAVLRQLLDEYAYTFEFSPDFYTSFANPKSLIQTFVEMDCLNASLREMAIGNPTQGFRHLMFALASYPEVAWKNPKTYAALAAWMGGPLARPFLKMMYKVKQANE
jgi:glycosyltransferase involved in cell wall biosynthesis